MVKSNYFRHQIFSKCPYYLLFRNLEDLACYLIAIDKFAYCCFIVVI